MEPFHTPTTAAFAEYNRLVTVLRDRRRSPDWDVDGDDPILEALESLWWKMSVEERTIVNNEGWKGEPEEYDARMKTKAEQ